MTSKRRSGWNVALWGLGALLLTALAFRPWLTGKSTLSPARLGAELRIVEAPGDGSLARRLGVEWDKPGWPATLRLGTPRGIEPGRAFRRGARAADLAIAVSAGDSLAIRAFAAELGADSLRGPAPLSAWFDLGAWIETARVAVLAGQLDFVRDRLAGLQRLKTSLGARPESERGGLLRWLFALEADLRKRDAHAVRGQLALIIASAGS